MKIKFTFLSFIAIISFFSCINTNKNTTVTVSDINQDFPVSATLDFKLLNEYGFKSGEVRECIIDDSILWITTINNTDNFGSCFDLNSGKELSVLINKGRADNELLHLVRTTILDDSIQFHSDLNVIKTFSKKDIIDNKPIYERGYSSITAPDSIYANYQAKLKNGSVLATLSTNTVSRSNDLGVSFIGYSTKVKFSEESVILYNNNETRLYKTIGYDSFEKEKDEEEGMIDRTIKDEYSKSHIGVKNDEIAVFALAHNFIIYTLNLNTGEILKNKRYGDMIASSFKIKENKKQSINCMKCNDDYIVCVVRGFFNDEDIESKIIRSAVLVYDWDLKPIKRFNIPEKEDEYYRYYLSEDCKSIYYHKNQDNGIAIFKSDINI